VLYIVARSVDQGRLAGIVSTLGVALGTLFHVAAAALGVSALLAASAFAFGALKITGAAYLIYLGVRRLRAKDAGPTRIAVAPKRLGRVFHDGVIVNVFNPKTALFFLAFLPQFVSPARGPVAVQMFFLGLIFVAMGILSDGLWAVLAGSLSRCLRRGPRILNWQRYLSGGVFIGLGLVMAFSDWRRT